MSRRAALLGRFRASALDRLRRVDLSLIQLGDGAGEGAAALVEEVARELHTIKGEARMLGQGAISDLVHEAETQLLSVQAAPEGDARAAYRALRPAVSAIELALRGDEGGAPRTSLAPSPSLAPPRRPAAVGEASSLSPAPAAQTLVPAFPASSLPSLSPAPARGASPSNPSLPLGPGAAGAAAPAGASLSPRAEAAGAEAWAGAPLGLSTPPAAPVGGAPGGSPPPAEDATSAPAAPAEELTRPQSRWVQVDAARIDELCERLVGFQAELRMLVSQLREAVGGGGAGGDRRLRLLVEGGERGLTQVDGICSIAWGLRLVPVGPMLEDLGRHARELADGLGKRLRAGVRGGEAQVERAVLDEIWEPLLHLVRNAVDHGIEDPEERGGKGPEGHLHLSAEPVGGSLLITVADDGRGVDPHSVRRAAVHKGLVSPEAAAALSDGEATELLFLHGFSTRAQVSDLSGRGVGLDVVRRVAEAMGGSVTLHSERGRGSRFLITVPVHVGTERVVVFLCEGALYAVPARSVAEVLRVADHPVEGVAGGQVLRLRDQALPLRSMSQALCGGEGPAEPMAMVLEQGGKSYAFTIPQLVGEYELLRRPADPVLARLDFLSASAVLDDGRLVLLLTVGGLLRRSESQRPTLRAAAAAPARRRVLVVDDSAIIRDLVCHVLRSGGLDVEEAPEPQTALTLLSASEPDAVLLDVDMPGMDGFELLERIRARSKHLPVIMFTTRFSPEDQARAASLGADAYLIKSQFQDATLLDTVRRFAGASVGGGAP